MIPGGPSFYVGCVAFLTDEALDGASPAAPETMCAPLEFTFAVTSLVGLDDSTRGTVDAALQMVANDLLIEWVDLLRPDGSLYAAVYHNGSLLDGRGVYIDPVPACEAFYDNDACA